jgi:glycine/D-amino acid oxidase-like deaminating enzyme
MVGAMTHHPNVLLNIGHGGHGTSISFSCAKIIEGISKGDRTSYFSKEVVDHVDSKRCLV